MSTERQFNLRDQVQYIVRYFRYTVGIMMYTVDNIETNETTSDTSHILNFGIECAQL